jgi:hypothetical protein
MLLHVEDDPLVTRAVSRAVHGIGLPMITAARCNEARSVHGRFRLGVFDIELPDGDGITLAQELLAAGKVERACFYTASTTGHCDCWIPRLGPVFSKRVGLHGLMLYIGQIAPCPVVETPDRRRAPHALARRAHGPGMTTRRAGK